MDKGGYDPQRPWKTEEPSGCRSVGEVLIGMVAGIGCLILIVYLGNSQRALLPNEWVPILILAATATAAVHFMFLLRGKGRRGSRHLRMFLLGFCTVYFVLALLWGCCAVMVSGLGR